MNAAEKLALIEARLRTAFQPSYLDVRDDSDQHVGHAGHQGGGRHFSIAIAATHFQHQTRIAAHREIYALFTDLMPEDIHALRISILSTAPDDQSGV